MVIQIYNIYSGFLFYRITLSLEMSDEPIFCIDKVIIDILDKKSILQILCEIFRKAFVLTYL